MIAKSAASCYEIQRQGDRGCPARQPTRPTPEFCNNPQDDRNNNHTFCLANAGLFALHTAWQSARPSR